MSQWRPFTVVIQRDETSASNKDHMLRVHFSSMSEYPFTLVEGQQWTYAEALKRKESIEQDLESYVNQRIAEKIVSLLQGF